MAFFVDIRHIQNLQLSLIKYSATDNNWLNQVNTNGAFLVKRMGRCTAQNLQYNWIISGKYDLLSNFLPVYQLIYILFPFTY